MLIALLSFALPMTATLGKLAPPTNKGKQANHLARPTHADQYFEAPVSGAAALLTMAGLALISRRSASAGETRNLRGVASAGTESGLRIFINGLSDNVGLDRRTRGECAKCTAALVCPRRRTG